MKHAYAYGATLAIALFASSASAAPSEGELLFREGRAAMAEKNYDRACTKFAESQKKEPAPGTALNLGDCEEQRGHFVAAAEAFNIAASTFTSPEKQRYASSRADAVERRIARLTIRAPKSVTGLVVRVGAKEVPSDTEVKLDPGDVVIRAEAPGRKPSTQNATLQEGKSIEVEITLEPTTPPDGPEKGGGSATLSPGNGEGTDLRPIGLVIGGVGVAGLLVGTVTGIMALGKASTVKDKCGPDLHHCDQEGKDAADAGSTLSTVSNIGVIGGGVLVVGGGLLYFLAPRAAKTTGAVQVVPVASQSAASLLLRGSF